MQIVVADDTTVCYEISRGLGFSSSIVVGFSSSAVLGFSPFGMSDLSSWVNLVVSSFLGILDKGLLAY